MKIGVIGVGGIAEKAYLPLYAAKRNHTFHFFTRKKETLDRLHKQYGFEIHPSLSLLFEEKLDGVMIHAATSAHEELISSCLEMGIPVFVDKPITDSLEATERLIQKAKEKGIPLMAGFNRRFVPYYQVAKSASDANMIILQKNRFQSLKDVRDCIYDDFIHVMDTLLYLLGGSPDDWDIKGQWKENMLSSIMVSFSKGQKIAVGIMNRDAGANDEILEVMSPSKKIIVSNLSDFCIYEKRQETRNRMDEWTPMLVTRGFDSMVNDFFDHLETGKPLPIQPADLLLTHEWCEKIISALLKNRAALNNC